MRFDKVRRGASRSRQESVKDRSSFRPTDVADPSTAAGSIEARQSS